MAAVEVLVRKFNGTAGRLSGNIVTVKDSPAVWGALEGPPKYIRIKVNGMTKEQFDKYDVQDAGTGVFDSDGNEITVRSKYRFNFSILPSFAENVAEVVINSVQVEPCLINCIDEFIQSR